MAKNLIAIPWWSLPFFALGMYNIFQGLNQGFIMLIMTGIISIIFRVLNYKFKQVSLIPWWAVPYAGLGIYDLTDYLVNPGLLLIAVTGIVSSLFYYFVYQYKKQSKIICPNCNDSILADKSGRLPHKHSSGKCKKDCKK